MITTGLSWLAISLFINGAKWRCIRGLGEGGGGGGYRFFLLRTCIPPTCGILCNRIHRQCSILHCGVLQWNGPRLGRGGGGGGVQVLNRSKTMGSVQHSCTYGVWNNPRSVSHISQGINLLNICLKAFLVHITESTWLRENTGNAHHRS